MTKYDWHLVMLFIGMLVGLLLGSAIAFATYLDGKIITKERLIPTRIRIDNYEGKSDTTFTYQVR